jgi:hypothetical protein
MQCLEAALRKKEPAAAIFLCAKKPSGSLSRECLDHVVIYGGRHLRQLLLAYMANCNFARTHLPLNKDARYCAPFRLLGAFTRAQLSADYTISIFGFDLR